MVPLPPAPSPALPTRIKEAASEFCLKVDTENKWVSKGAVALWQHGQVSQDGQAYKESVSSGKKVDRKLERPTAGTAARA